ncbi:MAG: hypothetical protein Q8O67_27710 [Deltaproteobacteria bacterium]|nr:hypothetical protein [Deltaproteobacteria bacterium]
MRRYRPPGVWPLEVWDVDVGDGPLHECRDLPRGVTALVTQLRKGTARRAPGRSVGAAFDVVTLAGGGPVDAVASSLRAAGFEVVVAADPLWIAGRGGASLLDNALVVDVGQTSVKRFANSGNERLWRPSDLTRASLVSWLASMLDPRAAGIVLALPAEIDDDLQVSACTYPWDDGDASLVGDVLRTAGCEGVPTLVLNDAELAAVSVDLDRRRDQSTLVLTLGLGVGAALLPSSSSSSSSSSSPQ